MIFAEQPTLEQVTQITNDFNVHFFRTILRSTILSGSALVIVGNRVEGVRDPFLLNDVHSAAEYQTGKLAGNDREILTEKGRFYTGMLEQYSGAREGVFADWVARKSTTWCHKNREQMTVDLRSFFVRYSSVVEFQDWVAEKIIKPAK